LSKNVAVFVDVANIFYAAKAAGVDIDYVTLLKAATAGRDFVRAYAYTGLDPENENQRQFHSFLGRNGYKVISKDIRKYGDGRIKANLDIELVVDMLKTARNLDIAVVVSGDGDFASAIRAVQEMGVRVEVISFRGNTSSDLIEVADQFTDIAQIARVDKSGRSGRRVAAEGDLSMTEVPEKETEGAPRRRRGVRGGRDERVAVEATAAAETADKNGNMIVLPGERLSRVGEADGDGEVAAEATEDQDAGELAAGANGQEDEIGEDGRRRRRRRGGRGRGRGRRPEDELVAGSTESGPFSPEEDEEFEDLPITQPPVHTFGSVWDSQLGVASTGMPPSVDISGGNAADEDDYAEPEVPEYLLAERRQRGQRQGGGLGGGRGRPVGGRNRSAYQAALDRERFGRGASATPQPSYGGGGGGGNRQPDRGRDRPRQGRPQQSGGRPPMDRGPRMPERTMSEPRMSGSSEPWSEVPPELEQMLRAELARKQPAPNMGDGPVEASPVEATATDTKPARRTRAPRKPTASAEALAEQTVEPQAAAETGATDAAKAPAKRVTRPRSTKPKADATPVAEATDAAAEEPKKPARRRRTTTATDEG
jgi:uncharacterized LabA/DUF88 family protein